MVTSNPPGSLPGMSNLATAPAIKPMMHIQMKLSILSSA
jgi:hypothetical protein